MDRTQYRNDLFTHFARIGKALANPARLELLDALAQGERNVDSLARDAGLSLSNTSQHLQRLRQCGLVSARKQGQQVIYGLAQGSVIDLLAALAETARGGLGDVEQLLQHELSDRDNLEPVSEHCLLDSALRNDYLVLDVRPREEYAGGHLPGAVNIPLPELESRLAELNSGREIVTYCRGPYCLLSYEAVALLRKASRNARRLRIGFPQWKRAGLPVD